MDTLVASCYNSSCFTCPEYDDYPDSIQCFQYDNTNEDTQYMYEVGTAVGIACSTDLCSTRDLSWDNRLSQLEDMDKSLEDVSKFSTDGWRHKHIQAWTPVDIMNWVIHEIKRHGLDYENANMKTSGITGEILWNMSRLDFEYKDPTFGGMLYDALQSLKSSQLPYSPVSSPCLPSFNNLRQAEDTFIGESVITCLHPQKQYQMCSDAESESSLGTLNMKPKRSDRPGRPTKRTRKPDKKTGRLWEFIRDLLKNRDYCPSLICWENYDEGVFRFVRSDKVAELWGTIKENPRMTYEKLSRAMRYYYKSKVLQPVLGRRLVYKFGPSATDWHTNNPNFRKSE